MPTVADLQRLEALISRLLPLSAKQRGELIAADDWNLLVGALVEVGRAALAGTDSESIAHHEHTDQVGIGWLDPRVRDLVTGGGVRDPAVETQFRKLRRDLTHLVGRLDRVGAQVDDSRVRIAEVATNELARDSALTRLNRKVLGAEDDRGDIADLRTTLRTLQTEVGRAVEVGTRLEVDGRPVDIPGLVERVTSVEQLRERLTRPDGDLLDAAALEVRLLELQTSVVTQDDLTQAIAEVRTDVRSGGLDLEQVLDAARLAGRETATATGEQLGADLRAEIANRLGDIEATVSTAVERATGSLVDEVMATTRAEIQSAVSSLDATVRGDLTGQIDERIRATAALLDERLATLPELVGAQVAQAVDTQVTDALAAVEGRLEQLQTNLTGLREATEANKVAIADVDLRAQTAARDNAAGRAQVRTELLDRITAVDQGLDPRIVGVVDDARAILRTDLEATVAAARRDLEARLGQIARDTAATEVAVLATSIQTDVRGVVRQEIDAELATVRAEVAAEVGGLGQRVAGMVANEVARATADIPRLVTAEFETFRPEIKRIVDSRINRPPNR